MDLLLCKKGVGWALVQTGELRLNNNSFNPCEDAWSHTPEYPWPHTHTHTGTADIKASPPALLTHSKALIWCGFDPGC